MQAYKWFTSSEDIILYPDNYWCYRYETEKYRSSQIQDFVVIPVGSLHYPDGITIHSVDYDTVIKQRKAYVEDLRVKLSDKGE